MKPAAAPTRIPAVRRPVRLLFPPPAPTPRPSAACRRAATARRVLRMKSALDQVLAAALLVFAAPVLLVGVGASYAALRSRDAKADHPDPELGLKVAYHFLLTLGVLIAHAGLTVNLFDLPNHTAILVTGWQPTNPIDLTPLGLPGCNRHVEPAVAMFVAGQNHTARASFAIPNLPELVGLRFHQQAVVLDPNANAAGAVMSDAMEGVIGHW